MILLLAWQERPRQPGPSDRLPDVKAPELSLAKASRLAHDPGPQLGHCKIRLDQAGR